MALGIVKFLTFDRFFLFLNILANYSAIFENLDSVQGTGCGILNCFCDYSQLFPASKFIPLAKMKFLNFDF